LGPDYWTGIYLGFQAGFAWGSPNFNFTGFDTSTGSPIDNSVAYTKSGAIGGAHIGYNYQIGQWVLGAEGSVDLTSSRSAVSFPSAFGYSSLTASTPSNVQGSIRGRLGYAFDRALIYATGGVTVADNTTSYQLIGNQAGNGGINGGSLFFDSNYFTNFPVGWTAGGGIDYAINDHRSVRGEYRYTSFGTVSNSFIFGGVSSSVIDGGTLITTPGLIGSSLSASRRLSQNQAQLGFSYKFDSQLGVAPAGAAPAPAAGLPPPPAIGWTGAYLGGQIGYGWGDKPRQSLLRDTRRAHRCSCPGQRRARRDRRRPCRL
jgi:outer membrane immunogenic protein